MVRSRTWRDTYKVSGKRLGALTAFFVLWSLLTISVLGTAVWEYSQVGHHAEACPAGDSTVGPSHWQWLPPGRVCDLTIGADQPADVDVVTRVLVPIAWLALLVVVIAAFRSYIHAQLPYGSVT